MNSKESIMRMAMQNNGVVTASMVSKAGLHRGSLKYLADKKSIIKVARGVYVLPNAWDDEMFSIQSRYKRGIYSLESSLFLCDLTDRTPAKYSMTFPESYNLTRPKEDGIRCKVSREPYYSLGVTELNTPCGNNVRAYNAERTLCDILKPQNRVDVQVVTDAFKRYMGSKSRNIPLLSEFAKTLKVESRLRAYMEVLL